MNDQPIKTYSNKSIAVLPFVNMSADPENEYFSDGITEEIINALTTVQGLKVIARTSSFAFKNKNIDIRTIGNLLGVNTILEGSVRKAKNKVRITAQLINTHDGTHFWSKNFDRNLEDIFALQDEISLLIADQIRENFGHFDIKDKLFESHTKSVEAYKTYLKGRFHQLKWDINNFNHAIDYYQKALKIDPTYPMPYYGLVQCYTYLFMWRAISKREAIKHTDTFLNKLKIANTNFAEYHLARSSCAILLHWNFNLAHEELEKTLAINPSNVDALEALAGLYIVIGSFKEGIKKIDIALDLNPLSANHSFMKGNIYYFAGEYEKAINWMDIAIDLDPNMRLAAQVKMACLLLVNKQTEFESFMELNREFPFAGNFQILSNMIHGHQEESWQNGDYKNEFQPWELYFAIHSGNHDQAFSVLKKGLDNQSGQYFCFRHDPFLKPIKEDKRFRQIIREHPGLIIHPIESIKPEDTQISDKMDALEKEKHLKALNRIMKENQPYLHPLLSLKSLSEVVQIHPNKLSWLLNEHIGKNFNEYINSFRLEAFKTKALDPSNSHLTILGLAYESGFNSKTVFNAFFKKMEGMTPRSWVKSKR